MRHGLRMPALLAGALALTALAVPGTASALPAITPSSQLPSSQLIEPAVSGIDGPVYSGDEAGLQEVTYKRRRIRRAPFWFYRNWQPRYGYSRPRRNYYYNYNYNYNYRPNWYFQRPYYRTYRYRNW